MDSGDAVVGGRPALRRAILSNSEVAAAVPMPDWDAKEELTVVGKVVRENVRFFRGAAFVKPLFLGKVGGRWVGRYRVNFLSAVQEFGGASRRSLASAFVQILWSACEAEGDMSCWEPSVGSIAFREFKSAPGFSRF